MDRLMPKVSVVIPAYNSAKSLPKAINSILSQTYHDYEIIIVDDGSIDNTKDVVSEYSKRYPERIRYFYQKNKRPAAARNLGLKNAAGELAAFLDADDVWQPRYLEKTVKLFESSDLDWIIIDNDVVFFDGDGNIIEKRRRHNLVSDKDKLYAKLLRENIIGSPANVVVKKSCFYKVGFFDESLAIREDWDMWIRFAREGLKVGFIEESLYNYNRYGNSLCGRERKLLLECTYRFIEKHRRQAFSVDPQLRNHYAEILWTIGRHAFFETKNYNFFLKCIFKSQIYHPSVKRIWKSLYTSLSEIMLKS
jgi:glycosyltransferase involved in cell wall biosynthesis